MRETLTAYLAALLAMAALDFGWLSLTTGPLYRRALAPLLADDAYMPAAVGFYLLYAAGVVCFAVRPARMRGGWHRAVGRGAFLGLIAYGTYDLTNLATLKDWPLSVTVIDMAWGSLLTAIAAGLGAVAAQAAET